KWCRYRSRCALERAGWICEVQSYVQVLAGIPRRSFQRRRWYPDWHRSDLAGIHVHSRVRYERQVLPVELAFQKGRREICAAGRGALGLVKQECVSRGQHSHQESPVHAGGELDLSVLTTSCCLRPPSATPKTPLAEYRHGRCASCVFCLPFAFPATCVCG